MKLAERFWSKVQKTETCWIWTAARLSGKYGWFGLGTGENILAHRMAYILEVGEIPVGKELHHKCSNKLCVNPAHLQPVTRSEHPDSGPSLKRANTQCPQGHPYSGENLHRYPSEKARRCRICVTAQKKASRERK